MPSMDKLAKKHVLFKLRNSDQSEGTVSSTETHGIWIQLSSNLRPSGINVSPTLKMPVIFVPFYQLEWLITSME